MVIISAAVLNSKLALNSIILSLRSLSSQGSGLLVDGGLAIELPNGSHPLLQGQVLMDAGFGVYYVIVLGLGRELGFDLRLQNQRMHQNTATQTFQFPLEEYTLNVIGSPIWFKVYIL